MSTHVSYVRPRWSDMDVFGHVNHANMVTLLEEARVPLLFGGARAAGLTELPKGIVVVRLEVRYHAPVEVDHRDVRVDISLRDLRFATFTLDYKVHNGPEESDEVAVTAETVLAPYDLARQRPRRLTDQEREFLRTSMDGSSSA